VDPHDLHPEFIFTVFAGGDPPTQAERDAAEDAALAAILERIQDAIAREQRARLQ
jgi:hypothetical protein